MKNLKAMWKLQHGDHIKSNILLRRLPGKRECLRLVCAKKYAHLLNLKSNIWYDLMLTKCTLVWRAWMIRWSTIDSEDIANPFELTALRRKARIVVGTGKDIRDYNAQGSSCWSAVNSRDLLFAKKTWWRISLYLMRSPATMFSLSNYAAWSW